MSEGLRILVVDDERINRESTRQQLSAVGHVAEAAENAFAALTRMESTTWDVVLTDLRMPGMDGVAFLKEIKRRSPSVEVIVMTAYGTVETAVSAMQEGAADYLTKPFRFAELDLRLRRIAEVRASRIELSRLKALLDDDDSVCGILGRSTALRSVLERVQLFADSSAPVLVTGETGTGKELVSRAIHELGPRKRSPFVALACGAIPHDLAESQLFGHEKGSFTGAVSRRKGCFEEATGGTLLLDDVDDLPLDIQVKLLRVLQEGIVRRVGGNEDITVDVRVIGTTKIDLSRAVEERRFRDDLFYRLRGLEISLPPLRERGDDVLLIARHFAKVLASKEGTDAKAIAPEAATLLRRYPWPGNVRELRRVMESAVALCRTPEIEVASLPHYLSSEGGVPRLFALNLDGQTQVNLAELVTSFEEEVLQWALRRAHGQQTKAAEIVGLPRTTLQSKLRQKS